jgi:hypothetical protein
MPAFPPTPITLNCSRLMTNFPSCIGNRRENVGCKMHMRRRHIAYPPYGHSHTRSHARRPRKWTCDGHQWQAWLPKFSNSPPCMCVRARFLFFIFLGWWGRRRSSSRSEILELASEEIPFCPAPLPKDCRAVVATGKTHARSPAVARSGLQRW